jgi:hypothetical protein
MGQQVRPTLLYGVPCLELRVDVCPAQLVDANAALRYNQRLDVGALVFDGDRCVLRHVVPADRVDAEWLERLLDAMSRVRDRVRSKLSDTAGWIDPELFA